MTRKKVKLFLTEKVKKQILHLLLLLQQLSKKRDKEIQELICSYNNLWDMC